MRTPKGAIMNLSDSLRELTWVSLGDESPDELVAEKLQPPDAAGTPFPSWSKACRDEGAGIGLARGWHVTLAASSGAGKSILGANIARAAVENGEHVGMLSLEMSMRQLDTRQLAIISGEAVRDLEPGHGFQEPSLRRALERVKEIDRTAGGRIYRSPELLRGIADIESTITFLRDSPAGCRIFVLDYLQLVANPNDPEAITDASHRVRQLARDLNVITICLSQFNRETHRRGGRPTIHDLMGGSAIENDSDQVLILDHSSIQQTPAPLDGWDADLLLAKNRHGPNVSVPIRFDTRTLRFRERMPDELPARAMR